MTNKDHALDYFNKGNLAQARELYLKAAEEHPNDAEAHYMLGVIYRQTNDPLRSENHFKNAIKLSPQSAMAVCGLATVYRSNKPEEAARLFLEAYRINPNLLDAYYEYAVMLYKQKEYKKARDVCFDMLSSNPEYFKAYYLLGEIKSENRDSITAVEYIKKALDINPSFGEAYFRLGEMYLRIGRIKDSINALEKSLNFITPNYDPYVFYGQVLMTAGQIEKARSIYDEALKINNSNTEAIAGIASIHIYKKDYQQANDMLMPIIRARNIASINIIDAYRRICKKFNTCNLLLDYIDYVERQFADMDESKASRIKFSKANVLEDLEDYSSAFKEYEAANNLTQKNYYQMEFELMVNQIRSVFTYDHMLKSRKSRANNKYIFIVGMPRSGTSLVEQILDSHSKAYGAGELGFIQTITEAMHSPKNTSVYPLCMPDLDEKSLTHYANSYVNEIEALVDTDAEIIIDKMPHNFVHIGLITQLFPESRIIHCKRNPIDNCLSIYFQNFNDAHAYANTLSSIAHQYEIYADLMKYWNSLLGDKIHTVEYEKLVRDFDAESKLLVGYCGLDWEESCSEFYKNKRHVRTASQDQVSKPIYPTSIERWRNYEEHITELIDKLKEYSLIN
jgi:tetratricopeptide (TPR) repeat protein